MRVCACVRECACLRACMCACMHVRAYACTCVCVSREKIAGVLFLAVLPCPHSVQWTVVQMNAERARRRAGGSECGEDSEKEPNMAGPSATPRLGGDPPIGRAFEFIAHHQCSFYFNGFDAKNMLFINLLISTLLVYRIASTHVRSGVCAHSNNGGNVSVPWDFYCGGGFFGATRPSQRLKACDGNRLRAPLLLRCCYKETI